MNSLEEKNDHKNRKILVKPTVDPLFFLGIHHLKAKNKTGRIGEWEEKQNKKL